MDDELREAQALTREDLQRMCERGTPAELARNVPWRIRLRHAWRCLRGVPMSELRQRRPLTWSWVSQTAITGTYSTASTNNSVTAVWTCHSGDVR